MAARDFLLIRLEAPLMSFGGPVVDALGPTRAFPGQAQITGLIGNALGYHHRDAGALAALQDRIRMAAALVNPGERLRDYQTVDLGRSHLKDTGWTTRGAVESRDGASSGTTHIRQRWYLADALVLIAVALDPPDVAPVLTDIALALDQPARPLFIGRKPCLPTAPLRLGETRADSAEDALRMGLALLDQQARRREPCRTDCAIEIDVRLVTEPPPSGSETDRLVDRRDWRNQMHTATRAVHRFTLAGAAKANQ
jgi:CRISPR system Cascade subunit CasD